MSNAPLTVAENFAWRLREVRRQKGFQQQDLSDAMREAGFPSINRAAISKIEAAARGVGIRQKDRASERVSAAHGDKQVPGPKPRSVSIEEAIAFAAVLDVPPASLYLPINRKANDVRLAGGIVRDVVSAHAWAHGEHALEEHDPDAARFYRFQTFAPPARTLAELEPH
jgi:transcriptional regulator with XRE-family HTH domain